MAWALLGLMYRYLLLMLERPLTAWLITKNDLQNMFFEAVDEDEAPPTNKDSGDNKYYEDNEGTFEEENPQKSSKLKLIIISVVVVVLAGAVFLFFFFDEFNKKDISLDENVNNLNTSGPAVYIKFPADEIMTILYDKSGRPHNIVLRIMILTRDERLRSVLENNSAVVISELLEFVEKQNYEYLLSFSEKQRLREKMLLHIKKTLPNYAPAIEKVLIVKILMD